MMKACPNAYDTTSVVALPPVPLTQGG
jgi:hypothetical protein